MDAIPIDMLEFILLRLDSQVSLLRAASTCKQWRRIIAGDVFLRRFGSLHKLPVVAGYYQSKYSARPRFEPSPRASDIDSGYFSLDFLLENSTSSTYWKIMDSKGTLLLLLRGDRNKETRDFIVCEPLTRRHEVFSQPVFRSDNWERAFLLGGDHTAEAGIGMSNFRAFCWVHDATDHNRAYVVSSGGSCRAVNLKSPEWWYDFIGFASGSLYWLVGDGTVLAVDDQAGTEYSSFLLPDPDVEAWDPFAYMATLEITVAVGGDGEPRLVLGDGGGDTPSILKVFARRPQAAGGEWALEKTIQLTAAMLDLPRLNGWRFVKGGRGVHSAGTVRVKICKVAFTVQQGLPEFSIDMDTMGVERLPDEYMHWMTYPTKLPWPPSLQACTCHD
ncbi:unnamed protein product [Urochloa humidicola]